MVESKAGPLKDKTFDKFHRCNWVSTDFIGMGRGGGGGSAVFIDVKYYLILRYIVIVSICLGF